MVAGTVGAADNADLTGITMSILVNGTPVGTTPLYGFDGSSNFYQINLGMLAEGTYTVEAQFPRTKIQMPNIIYVDEYQPSSASIQLGKDPVYQVSKDSEQIRVGKLQITPAMILIPVAVVGGLALLWWVTKK